LSHDDVAHAATVADMMMCIRATSFAVANARIALCGGHGSRHQIMSMPAIAARRIGFNEFAQIGYVSNPAACLPCKQGTFL
jgi:hypothetical protein